MLHYQFNPPLCLAVKSLPSLQMDNYAEDIVIQYEVGTFQYMTG